MEEYLSVSPLCIACTAVICADPFDYTRERTIIVATVVLAYLVKK